MKPLPILALMPLLTLAAACATSTDVYRPVDNVHYSALGADPFWMVTIGDDRIVLTLGHEGGRADGALESFAFPRSLPRITDEVRTWESGDGSGSIIVEARRGPCTGSGGRQYEDEVRVRLADRRLSGCGGRLLGEDQG